MPVTRRFAMNPLDLLDHLLNFVAPAFAVGFLCAILGRIAMRRVGSSLAWWAQGAVNFLVGVAVLAMGLVVFGHDGKMATYAGLVVACGTSQWLVSGGWRG
jgi:TRAP-type C4-dicarboxylate transport system permease small subunit